MSKKLTHVLRIHEPEPEEAKAPARAQARSSTEKTGEFAAGSGETGIGRRHFVRSLGLGLPLLPLLANSSRSAALELARKGSAARARESSSGILPPASPSSPLASAVGAENSGTQSEAFDPLSVLYGRRLWFENGEPLVTVRILEGEHSFRFTPLDSFSAKSRGKHATRLQFPAGGRWTVRLRNGLPGTSVDRALVGEHLFANSEAASADAELFRQHGWEA